MSRRARIATTALAPLPVSLAVIFALHPRAVIGSLFVIALIASALVPLLVRTMPVAIPLSPFAGHWRIGIDFFERLGATRATSVPVAGLVDTLEDLAQPGLSTAAVHPALRAFFERTASHDLFSRPHWHLAFCPFRPLVTLLCRNIAQFDIPVADTWIDTRLFGLDPSRDPRSRLRGVIRTYAGTDRPMQVAAYAVHTLAGVGYMNCAFPLPGGNLTGILRLDPIAAVSGRDAGVALTSYPRDIDHEDAGVWYVTDRLRIRLPLDETLSFWPAGAQPFKAPTDIELGEISVIGEHVMRLFGIRFITSRYFIRPGRPQ